MGSPIVTAMAASHSRRAGPDLSTPAAESLFRPSSFTDIFCRCFRVPVHPDRPPHSPAIARPVTPRDNRAVMGSGLLTSRKILQSRVDHCRPTLVILRIVGPAPARVVRKMGGKCRQCGREPSITPKCHDFVGQVARLSSCGLNQRTQRTDMGVRSGYSRQSQQWNICSISLRTVSTGRAVVAPAAESRAQGVGLFQPAPFR